jgi:acyl transferase domain-containing protein
MLTRYSMTIDTACSGGLVSLDVACRYLSTGEADGAIVAGANIYLNPEHNLDSMPSKTNILSEKISLY